jgi:hypothetical protein
MRTLADAFSKLLTVFTLSAVLIAPQMAYSNAVEEDPSALAMTGDLLIARPLLLVTTVVGTAAYLISLPFSLAGGNAGQAGDTLVVQPAKATFVRCLGCTQSGYKKDTVSSD